MNIALMQPYFFPYLGYFDLVHTVDLFVVFDEAQHIRRGWIGRNRILHPVRGWQYINVPLQRAPQNEIIKNIKISEQAGWRSKILGQLHHYKKSAPYFDSVISTVTACLEYRHDSISRFNLNSLKVVCDLLNIPAEFKLLSECGFNSADVHDANDWAIKVCKYFNGTTYTNLPGGESLYDINRFANNGLELEIRHSHPLKYSCAGYEYHEGLSIIDLLMWNSPEAIFSWLVKNQDQSEGEARH